MNEVAVARVRLREETTCLVVDNAVVPKIVTHLLGASIAIQRVASGPGASLGDFHRNDFDQASRVEESLQEVSGLGLAFSLFEMVCNAFGIG
jgi:hypothetical protein